MDYKKLNLEKIKVLSEEIRKAMESLKEYAQLQESEVLGNKTILNAAKYNFIIAIQATIDLCHHIVAKLAGKIPDEYGGCFLILKDMGLIDEAYALRLKAMAGFRNILIHLYHEVDDKRVIKHLKEDLWVIERFLDVVGGLIKEQ